MLFEVTRRHARVAVYFRVIAKTLLLKLPCAHNALADGSGSFLSAFAGDVAVLDRGHFNVQIDAIEQWTGDALPISLHLKRSATAFALQVAEIAAGAGIHRRNEHELRRKSDAARCARHGHLPVFEWLAHDFQRRSFKLGQLIEKQNTIVSDAYFTGIRKRAATKQANVAYSVMRITKRSRRDERSFRIEQASDAMDLRRLNRFLERQRRNNGRNTFGQHRFSRPGRADHQSVVTAGDGHFNRALHVALTLDITEIDVVTLVRGEKFGQVGA